MDDFILDTTDYTTALRLRRDRRQQKRFLRAFAANPTIRSAARAAGVSVNTHYRWLKRDEDYRERFEDIRPLLMSFLEGAAYKRAVEGVQKPVFHRGEICGHVREYSDTLLAMLLKANDPRYRDKADVSGKVEHEHSGTVEHTVSVQDVLQQVINDDSYVEYCRTNAAAGQSGHVRSNGKPGAMAIRQSLNGDRPGSNGYHSGSNGSHSHN